MECRAFESIEDILHAGIKFDCVVLMNVLHELEVNEWVKTFSEIYEVLEEDGYLLIFEVIILLHGEQPYGDSGYILLGEKEIRKLFVENNIHMIRLKNNDKTNLFAIPKSIIKNVSTYSVYNAVHCLKERLYDELKVQYNYRKKNAADGKEVSQQKVKSYGFLSQHYLNSMFAIETLELPQNESGKKKSKKVNICKGMDIDSIMKEIEKHSDFESVNRFRQELLKFKSKEDREIILQYLRNGSFRQKKSARYYFMV